MSWSRPHTPVLASVLATIFSARPGTMNCVATFFVVTCVVASTLSQEPGAEETDRGSYPILSGVGLALHVSEDTIYIFKVVPDSVAGRSKAIGEGDQLLSVQNGDRLVSVQGKPFGEVVSLLRGPVGSKVTLEVRPKNQEASIKVSLTRAAIRLEGIPRLTYKEFIGQNAPELSFATLDGSVPVKLSAFRGKIVVLDFWATWCPTCYQPVEDLQKLVRSHPEWKDNVAFLTAAVDSDLEKASRIIKQRAWTRTTNLSIDAKALSSAGIEVLPVLLIVSRDGRIVALSESHAIDVEQEVKRLLASEDRSPR